MKIWLFLSRFGHGGLERVQLNIARFMNEASVDVSIVARQFIADTHDELPASLLITELSGSGFGIIGFCLELIRALRRERPEIVFTTANDIACLIIMLRLLLPQRFTVVVTQHQSLSGPRKSAHGLKRLKLEIIRLVMRVLLPHATKIIAVSRGVADDMRQDLRLPDLKIKVIYNPIITPDFEELMQQPYDWPWQDSLFPTIIFVGRLSPEKCPILLLESFCRLIRVTPARLLIVGTGPLQDEIEQTIRKRGIGEYCRLAGFVRNPLPLIRASDVLVLPSIYEGFGNVLVEAMACGTQAISTDCPFGPAEILENGKFGQLIPMGDATALETAIRRTLDSSFHIAPNVLKKRANAFTLEVAANQYMALLS